MTGETYVWIQDPAGDEFLIPWSQVTQAFAIEPNVVVLGAYDSLFQYELAQEGCRTREVKESRC